MPALLMLLSSFLAIMQLKLPRAATGFISSKHAELPHGNAIPRDNGIYILQLYDNARRQLMETWGRVFPFEAVVEMTMPRSPVAKGKR